MENIMKTEELKKPPRVLIGTPTLDGNLTVEYVSSLMFTNQKCAQYGITLDLCMLRGDCFIDKARNNIAKQFLDGECDKLFFIDSDQGWDADAFVRIVLDHHELVAGAVPKKADDLQFNCLNLDAAPNGDCFIENGFLRAKHVGTGFMCVSRSVFEKMIAAHPEDKYRPGDGSPHESLWNFFATGPLDGQYWGEDLYFCEKWKNLGGYVWIDPCIDFVHTGRKAYKGNLYRFLQANGAVQAGPTATLDRPARPSSTDFGVSPGKGGAWLLPSKGRPDVLNRFLDAAFDTGLSTPGYVLVGEAEHDEYAEKVTLPPGWVIVPCPGDSLAEAVRSMQPFIKGWSWVGLLTDDVVPETQGWDTKLLAHHNGRQIISCDDGVQAPRRMVGATIFPVDFFRATGYWYPEGFRHCFVDDVWETLGRETKGWKVVMDVVVRHMNPWVTGETPDATHDHAYSQLFWNNDKECFDRWTLYQKNAGITKIKEILAVKEVV